jgi:phosphonate ABC transporter permease subunit PhnE
METKIQTEDNLSPAKHAVRTFLVVLALILLYAFAVQATEINLEEAADPGRQSTFVNVLRKLASPDIFTFGEANNITGLSQASEITIVRIIETIFMALMASTIGTILAVPASFLAARNLMAHVTAPLAAIMAGIIALPIGGWLGGQASSLLVDASDQITNNAVLGVGALLLTAAVSWPVLRLGPPILGQEHQTPGSAALFVTRILAAILLLLFGLGVIAHLGLRAGGWLQTRLDIFDFLGNFVFVSSDFLRLILPALTAFVGALVAASLGSRYGQEAVLRLEGLPARLLTAVLTALGTAVFVYGVGSFLTWLYLFDEPQNWTTIPAAVGGGLAGPLSLAIAPKRPFPIGFTIYNFSRGLLNILRSIEPLILGIVFVVWVSLGPFAGVMALTLHSIAALGKLFSEQVEGIAQGPVEAVTATGANRLQTIAFAVIPQIVPPYIAFTLYRWDINVRLSTIIGFVGGGGIGFVLSQNIQRLRYEQASVMMIAIAVVVSTLDYVSSKVRSRII